MLANCTTRTQRLATLLALSVVNLFATAAFADEQSNSAAKKTSAKHYYKSFLGKKPPELKAAAAHWVNQSSAVTLEKLHGRVVWLEFNF